MPNETAAELFAREMGRAPPNTPPAAQPAPAPTPAAAPAPTPRIDAFDPGSAVSGVNAPRNTHPVPPIGNLWDWAVDAFGGVLNAPAEAADAAGSIMNDSAAAGRRDQAYRATHPTRPSTATDNPGTHALQVLTHPETWASEFGKTAQRSFEHGNNAPGLINMRDALVRSGAMDAKDGDLFPNARPIIGHPVAPNAPLRERPLITQRETLGGDATGGIAQFLTGYLTMGRVLGPVAAGERVASGGVPALRTILSAMGKGAVTDFAVFDGNQQRLSNVVQMVPELRNPVTQFLASNEDDPETIGRIKSVLEGAGLGATFEAFFAGLRVARGQRAFQTGTISETDFANQVAEANAATNRLLNDAHAAEVDQSFEHAHRAVDANLGAAVADRTRRTREAVDANVQVEPGQSPTRLSPAQETELRAHSQEVGQLQAQAHGQHRAIDMQRAVHNADTETAVRIAHELETPIYLEHSDQPLTVGGVLGTEGGPLRTRLAEIRQELLKSDTTPEASDALRNEMGGIVRQLESMRASGAQSELIAPDGTHINIAEYRPRVETVEVQTHKPPEPLAPVNVDELKQRLVYHKAIADSPVEAEWAKEHHRAEVQKIEQQLAQAEGTRAGPLPSANTVETQRQTRLVLSAKPGTSGAHPRLRNLRPNEHQLDIIPGEPASIEGLIRAARAQTTRMEGAAQTAATHGEATALRAQAGELDTLTAELSDTLTNGKDANEVATRLLVHLDDEATKELFPKRDPELEARIGQSDARGTTRARGANAVGTIGIDADMVRALADRFALVKDGAASHFVLEQTRAWNAGHLPTRASSVNLEHIGTDDDVKAFVNTFAQMVETQTREIRGETQGHSQTGVRTDAQRDAIARQLAEDMGSDIGTMLSRTAALTGGVQHLDSKIAAMRMLHVSAADEAQRTMRAFMADKSDANLNRALIASQAFATLHGAATGIKTEVARGLRSLRAAAIPDRGLVEQFANLTDESIVRALDPTGQSRSALDALQKLGTMLSYAPTRKGMANGIIPKWSRAIEDYYTASILSAPRTQELNFISNLMATASTPAEKLLGAALHGDLNGLREGIDHIGGMLATAREAGLLAWNALKNNRTYLDSTFEADHANNIHAETFGLNPDKFFGKSVNNLGHVIGVVHRVMGAQDEFFKQLNYRSDLYSSAMSNARSLGLKNKQAVETYVNEFVTKGFTGEGTSIRAGVSEEAADVAHNAYDRALQLARRNTFTQPLGRFTGALERVIRMVPFGRLIIPFVRTPINIVKYAIRHSPLAFDLWRDLKSPIARVRQQALGQMALGTVIYGTALTEVMQGNVTGYGPRDPEERANLQQTGWQPYSLRLSDGKGGYTYHSYNRLDPYGLMFGTMADLHDTMASTWESRPDDIGKTATLIVVHLAQQLKDKTFFTGIADILDAMAHADPGKEEANAERITSRLAGGFIPSLVTQATADGFMREPRSFADGMLARVNAPSVDLRRNFFGEPVRTPHPYFGHDFVSPGGFSNAGGDKALDAIAAVAVASHNGLSPRIERTVRGVDLTQFVSPVTHRTAYDRLQERMGEIKLGGHTFREAATQLVTSHRWDRMTDGLEDDGLSARGSRLMVMTALRTRYFNAALRDVRKEIPELGAELNRSRNLQRQARRPQAPGSQENEMPAGLDWLRPTQ